MKIGRSQDHLSIRIEATELAELCRRFGIKPTAQIRVSAKLVPGTEIIRLFFDEGGRVGRFSPDGTYWTVALDPDAASCGRLEHFGLTDAKWRTSAARSVEITIPSMKRPLKRRRAVMTKPQHEIPVTRTHEGLRLVAKGPPQPAFVKTRVDNQDLMNIIQVYNTALERGFRPLFDGRGRILYFEHVSAEA